VRSTQLYAFVVTIDRFTGRVFREQGPDREWNLRYPLGVGTGRAPAPVVPQGMFNLPVTRDQATALARAQLAAGQELGRAVQFYGYWNFLILEDGQPIGELDVHGFTGEVRLEHQPRIAAVTTLPAGGAQPMAPGGGG